jgi:hypothetical protein
MGEWFDLLADRFSLPRAPRLPREEVRRTVPPLQWSFMSESRRLDNTRMKRELRLRLRYPTVAPALPRQTSEHHALDKSLSYRLRRQLVRRAVLPAAHLRQSGHGAGRQPGREGAAAGDGAQAVSLHHPDRRAGDRARPVAVVRLWLHGWLAACQDRAGGRPRRLPRLVRHAARRVRRRQFDQVTRLVQVLQRSAGTGT